MSGRELCKLTAWERELNPRDLDARFGTVLLEGRVQRSTALCRQLVKSFSPSSSRWLWHKFARTLYLCGDDPSFCSPSTCRRTWDGSLFLSLSIAYIFLFKWIFCAGENTHIKNYQNKSHTSTKLCKPWKAIKTLPSFIQPEIKFSKPSKNWHFYAKIFKKYLICKKIASFTS